MAHVRELKNGSAAVSWIVLGPLANNVYFVEDGQGGVVVVDPSSTPEAIYKVLAGRPVSALLVTHGHHDHIGALEEVRSATGAPVIAADVEAHRITHPKPGMSGQISQASKVDRTVADGDTFSTGALTWRVIHTPGHTEGSVCYMLEPADSTDPQGSPVLFSGDTLFNGTIGRTDFEGGSMSQMRASLGKLAQLSDDTVVLPGHEAPTTIGAERQRTIEAIRNDRWMRP